MKGCKEVDHNDRKPLNNRKSNLRVCTRSQNMINRPLIITNKSGYTGVFFYKRTNSWQVSITVNYKKIHLGYYKDIEDAICARKKAENKYFGGFLNES